jgi:hypothetical protein
VTVKVWILRGLTWLALRGKLYYVWSRIYRFLFERKRIKKYRIPGYTSLPDGVERTVDRMRWRKDTWVMLFDAVSHPHATLGRHLEGLKAGDCDDISLFAAWAIRDMMRRGFLAPFRFVGLLSVPWLDGKGKCGGHNVCVVSYVDPQTNEVRWAHVSNWRSGQVQTHDRRNELFADVRDVVRDVLSGPSRDRNCTSLGWARADCDLKLVEYHNGRNM